MTNSRPASASSAFESYVQAYRRGDTTVTARIASPVLVHLGNAPGHDGQATYKTEMADPTKNAAPAILARLTAPRGPIDVAPVREPGPWGLVFPVAKRRDALYHTHIGVGRATNVDVYLPFPMLSKFHAYFIDEARDGFSIADAASKNGSWLNGERLEPKQPAALTDRARVRLGPYEFMYLVPTGFQTAVKRGSLD
jgi:hypothetical protein